MIVSFFKARLWHWNNRDFIKDMKKQVKNIEGIISPPEIVYPKVKTAKELHEEIIKEEKDTKKGSMKKNSNVKVIIPKGISAPFVSKKQAKHYWEYRKMIEDMEKDTHELF
ncbi:MAG: hypothetical protein GY870_13935 [archaeon]|nr:hypothetical protein [archaeon]